MLSFHRFVGAFPGCGERELLFMWSAGFGLWWLLLSEEPGL